ncbi:hypothetical protein EON63_07790 [archaeon]|nr:MAG: hypothetical protein EON63_07790 [archaeon]
MIFLLLVIISTFAVASATQGEIISCSRCKLNSLPEVRRFLKEVGVIKGRTINLRICKHPLFLVLILYFLLLCSRDMLMPTKT